MPAPVSTVTRAGLLGELVLPGVCKGRTRSAGKFGTTDSGGGASGSARFGPRATSCAEGEGVGVALGEGPLPCELFPLLGVVAVGEGPGSGVGEAELGALGVEGVLGVEGSLGVEGVFGSDTGGSATNETGLEVWIVVSVGNLLWAGSIACNCA
jgi:hypothetical protein